MVVDQSDPSYSWVISDDWSVTKTAEKTFEFRSTRSSKLEFGHVPDWATIIVVGQFPVLDVTAESAPWVTLKAAAGSTVRIAGKFMRIEIEAGRTSSLRVFCATAPATLTLRSIRSACHFTIDIEKDRKDGVQLELDAQGSPITLSSTIPVGSLVGTASDLNLTSSKWGRVKVDAPVRTPGYADFQALECSSFTSAGDVHIQGTLNVSGELRSHTRPEITVTADRIIAGAIYGVSINCHYLEAHGPVVTHHSQMNEALKLTLNETTLALTSAQAPTGSSQVRTTDADVHGPLITPNLVVEGPTDHTATVAAESINTRNLISVGPASITTESLIAERIELTEGAVECKNLTVTSRLEAHQVTATNIHLAGHAATATFDVRNLEAHCVTHGVVRSSGALNVHLEASIETVVFEGTNLAVWKGASVGELALSSGTASIEGTVEHLTIDGTKHPAEVELNDHDEPIRVAGAVTLISRAVGAAEPVRWRLLLGDDADVKLVARERTIVVRDIDLSGHQLVALTEASLGERVVLHVARPQAPTLVVNAVSGRTEIHSGNPIGPTPHVILRGAGTVTLNGTFDQVTASGTAVRLPCDANIRDWQGFANIVEIAGSATSVTRRQAMGVESRPAAAVLVSVPVDELLAPGSRLVGFDATQLTHQQITALGGIEVFIPDYRSITRYAKVKEKDPTRVIARAQWISNLHQQVERYALSGSARNAVGWSEARLHHKSTYSNAKFEWGSRFFHRWFVGYGHKVTPPLVTWAMASLVLTLLMVRYVDGVQWDTGRTLMRTAFYPLTLLRYAGASSSPINRIPDWFRPLAAAAVTIPLTLTVLAIRNFFRTQRPK